MRTDIKNERRNNLLMVLFGIAFFIIVSCATGQVVRMDNIQFDNTKSKLIYPSDAITLKSPNGKGEIYLSILIDSLGINDYKRKLYAFFPKELNINNCHHISIQFADKSVHTFGVMRSLKDENYLEYFISEVSYNKLKSTKIQYIDFELAQSFILDKQDFFASFLSSI